jgi:hypothetical protein
MQPVLIIIVYMEIILDTLDIIEITKFFTRISLYMW